MDRDSHHSTALLVIGVGNEQRGDDAIGLLVSRHIRALNLPGVSTRECSGDVSLLLEMWKETQAVVVIDAVSSGRKPGTLYRWNAARESLPVDIFPASSHSFGVAQAIELARALGQIPPVSIVYGIEAKQFDLHAELSLELLESLDAIVQQIQIDLMNLGSPS